MAQREKCLLGNANHVSSTGRHNPKMVHETLIFKECWVVVSKYSRTSGFCLGLEGSLLICSLACLLMLGFPKAPFLGKCFIEGREVAAGKRTCGTFVWNGVSKTSSSGFPQKCHVLKVSFSAALMIRKAVATRLSHSMNGSLVSHRVAPRCFREAGFRNDSAVGQFALCNTGQSHQDFSYGDWSGGLVAKSPYCSSKGLKFSSHHPHLTAHNHLWF